MIRNSKWTFDVKQFQQSFGTYKIVVYESWVSKEQVLTPLYRGVKDTLEIAKTSKKSRLKLDQITNDLMPDLVIVLWRINFKFIPSLEEHRCRHNCFSCTSRHKNIVVQIVVVHFVQKSFFNALNWISIQCLQIHLK